MGVLVVIVIQKIYPVRLVLLKLCALVVLGATASLWPPAALAYAR